MNDDYSDDKTEDKLQSLYIGDGNGNTYAYKQKSPPTQNSSTNNVSWNSANPDDMVVDYETSSAVDIGETISLNPQSVDVLDHQKSSNDFLSKETSDIYKGSTCQSFACVINSEEPKYLHNSCHSLESFQDQSVETSLPFAWKRNKDDLTLCRVTADDSSALALNQTFDMKMDNIHDTFVVHPNIEKSQALPTGTRNGNTSLSCSLPPFSHADERHVRETHCDKDCFENPQARASESQDTSYTAFSEVVMQTDVVVPDIGSECHCSSEKVTSEYPDGAQQRLGGEKEIQALTPVSDGMDVSSGSVLQEFFCSSKDEPKSEMHSWSSYGQKEMGQNLRETVSNCLIDDECSLLVPTFDNSTTQVLDPEHQVTVAKDTPVASNGKDSGTQNHTVEWVLNGSMAGQKVASSFELSWDTDNMAIGTNNLIGMSTPILEPTKASFSISPIDLTDKCSKIPKSNRELRNLPNLKGAQMNMSKPTLGKSTTKTNTPVGSKVRSTEIISYPRPNFKNVKAKVISRRVLQPKDPALSEAIPTSQLTGTSLPSSVSSSRQVTVLNKTPTSDLNAEPKAEILINKTHKQQFNKLITSQAVHVTTHSKNASHKLPRATSAMKSNQEDVDKASSSNSACESGPVAAFFQKIKGELPVKMESTECVEMTYTSNIDGISPEKKGEKENGTLMAKQQLKKEIMNETFDCGSLFLGSAPKRATISGRNITKPNSSILRKIPVPKAKVGPSISCWRRNSDSRNLNSDRTLSPQRIRLVPSSGKNQTIQLCLIAAYEIFECKNGSYQEGERQALAIELEHIVSLKRLALCGPVSCTGKNQIRSQELSPYP
uniref:Microtubule-associated tumor suppressor 1 n=1 Tax=Sus scrofa TaxID=9823 RepID=A0A8D0P3A0_PIG